MPDTPPSRSTSADPLGDRRCFVLGDSRTGTLALHNYFRRNGVESIHYYVADSGVTMPLHQDVDGNRRKTLDFIRTARQRAFSDYPTRFFWRDIVSEYPDAFYILTRRNSEGTWLSSMENFFSKFDIPLDRDHLLRCHRETNAEILARLGNGEFRFLELCIDDDNAVNSEKLAQFLSLVDAKPLSRDNRSSDYDPEILSGRGTAFGENDDALSLAKSTAGDGKAILGEYGWLFLINDRNAFLDYQCGGRRWSDAEASAAGEVLASRLAFFDPLGVPYRKFIVPEKSAVYGEYLPRSLQRVLRARRRPAHEIASRFPNAVFHLERYLRDARSYGPLYFRGDTHPTWLGAYFIYRYVLEKLSKTTPFSFRPLALRDFEASLASYDGDLYSQLDDEMKRLHATVWGFTMPTKGFDTVVRLELAEARRLAKRREPPALYQPLSQKRDVLVYEHPDPSLPKAVVFRDSTFDFVHEALAQHFSRSVFVWYEGNVVADVIDEERPDVVIHGMAERFVSAYPTFRAVIRMASAPRRREERQAAQ